MDTPAGRLLEIFDEMRSVGAEAPFCQAWARTLGYEVNSQAEVAHLSELAALLRRIEVSATAVAASSPNYDQEALLHGYPAWSAAVFGWGKTLAPNQRYSGEQIVPEATRASLAATHNLLHAAARELVLPDANRDDLLANAQFKISGLVDEIVSDLTVPEGLRLRLVGRLIEAREAITMVQYRGDQEVAAAIESARLDLSRAVEQEFQYHSSSPLQPKLRDWSETVRIISGNIITALAGPLGVAYFLGTGDLMGAGLIVGSASPELLRAVVATYLGVNPTDVQPPAIEKPEDG